jgi:hypothetical protein
MSRRITLFCMLVAAGMIVVGYVRYSHLDPYAIDGYTPLDLSAIANNASEGLVVPPEIQSLDARRVRIDCTRKFVRLGELRANEYAVVYSGVSGMPRRRFRPQGHQFVAIQGPVPEPAQVFMCFYAYGTLRIEPESNADGELIGLLKLHADLTYDESAGPLPQPLPHELRLGWYALAVLTSINLALRPRRASLRSSLPASIYWRPWIICLAILSLGLATWLAIIWIWQREIHVYPGLGYENHIGFEDGELELWFLRTSVDSHAIPYWVLLTLLLILPALWMGNCIQALRRMRRRRINNGFCGVCGYDLRATPHRCPECGTIAQA